MNILNALKQLRDDIKTWATNNFNALNAKIDEKTIPIDSELSSTSTNPVQNKAIASEIDDINKRVGDTSVANQISSAIAKQPHFSGDYNDLTNAPNITEDDGGNMVIADENGNIIFKADAEGIHTTALSLNGEAAATETYVDNAIANIDIPEVDFTGYATEEFVTGAIDSAKEELSESIVAESDEWKVADEAGNIIFRVDASGAHTTELTLNGDAAATESYVDDAIANIEFPTTDLTDYATKEYVDNAVDGIEIPDVDFTGYATETYVDNKVADLVNSAPEALNTLGELATALENHEDAYDALLETIGSKATHTDLENLKDEISESIVSETDEFYIVDEAGNIVASIDENGVTTTTVTAQSIIVNGDNVEEHIDDTNIHVTAAEKEAWNNKSNFSGSYNDLADKPAATDLSNYYTKTEVDTAINNVEVDLDGYATEKYVDDAIDSIVFPETDLSDYYTKLETDTAIETTKQELSESIVSESEEWTVVDNNGNIVATISAAGLETTTVIAQNLVVNGEEIGASESSEGVVTLTGDQTIDGVKTFKEIPLVENNMTLPDEYQQLDKLISGSPNNYGASQIDLGFTPPVVDVGETLVGEAKVKFRSIVTSPMDKRLGLFGCAQLPMKAPNGSYMTISSVPPAQQSVTVRHTITKEPSTMSSSMIYYYVTVEYITEDGNIITAVNRAQLSSLDASSSMKLFGDNAGPLNHYLLNDCVELTSFVVKYNDEVLFDGIPCYRKSDNVVGIYNLVDGRFSEPSPNNMSSMYPQLLITGGDETTETICRHVEVATTSYVDTEIEKVVPSGGIVNLTDDQIIGGNKTFKNTPIVSTASYTIPDEYQAVDKLISGRYTGNQWATQVLNTGVLQDSSKKMVLDVKMDLKGYTNSASYSPLGANYILTLNGIGTAVSKLTTNKPVTFRITSTPNGSYYFPKVVSEIDENGVETQIYSSTVYSYTGYPILLFGQSTSTTVSGTSGYTVPNGTAISSMTSGFELYSCKITADDEVVFEGYPCYRKSDNKPGLYDIISQKFIEPMGTTTAAALITKGEDTTIASPLATQEYVDAEINRIDERIDNALASLPSDGGSSVDFSDVGFKVERIVAQAAQPQFTTTFTDARKFLVFENGTLLVNGIHYTFSDGKVTLSGYSANAGDEFVFVSLEQILSTHSLQVSSFYDKPEEEDDEPDYFSCFYSIDNGQSWIEIKRSGVLTTEATQVKFKLVATVGTYSCNVSSTALGGSSNSILVEIPKNAQGTYESPNYILTQDVSDISIYMAN